MEAWLGDQAPTLLGMAVAVALLWWRMRAVEKQGEANETKIDKVQEKLEALNGPRIMRLEEEMMRSRDRLHRLEGRGDSAKAVADLLLAKLDEFRPERGK